MSSPRNLSVDALRFLAAFGVILIHLAPSTEAAGALTRVFSLFAVPFFLAVSLYFFVHRVRVLPRVGLADLRLDRLLVPYAAWTVIYTLLRVLKFRLEGRPQSIDFISVTFFGGAAVQLYFLPLLLFLQMLALATLLLTGAWRCRLAGACVGLGVLTFGYVASAGDFFGFQNALTRGATYVALAFLLEHTQADPTGRRINLALGWVTFAFLLASPFLNDPLSLLSPIVQGPLVGYGTSALVLNLRLPISRPSLHALLTCSYGVYLAHFVFLESFEVLAKKLHYALAPYSVGAKLIMGGLIYLSSVLFVAVVRLRRLPAYLLLGESMGPIGQPHPAPDGPSAAPA